MSPLTVSLLSARGLKGLKKGLFQQWSRLQNRFSLFSFVFFSAFADFYYFNSRMKKESLQKLREEKKYKKIENSVAIT